MNDLEVVVCLTENSLLGLFQDLSQVDLLVLHALQFRAKIVARSKREILLALFVLQVAFQVLNFLSLQGHVLFVLANASIALDQVAFQLIAVVFGELQLRLQLEILVILQLPVLLQLFDVVGERLHVPIVGERGVFEFDVELSEFVLQRDDHLTILFVVQGCLATNLVEFHLQTEEIVLGHREFLRQRVALRLSDRE